MKIEDIEDALVKFPCGVDKVSDEHFMQEHRSALLYALTTLRDLKQELKEVGDMPNKIYAYTDIYGRKTWDEGENGIDSSSRQYTRTTPTLKKIMEGL